MGPRARRLARRVLGLMSASYARVPLLARCWFAAVRFARHVTITYISLDDPELVEIAYRYYRKRGITIAVFLDDKSSAETLEYLRARSIPFATVANPKNYVEPLYGEVARHVTTPWMFILTNDELLNVHSLVEASVRVLVERDVSCFALQRSWAMMHGGIGCTASAEFMGPDYQFRLVRHAAVTFHDELHTPGFDVPSDRKLLTEASRLYHFDWIVRTQDNRRRKLERYEQMVGGMGERYLKWYLPEDYLDEYVIEELTDPALREPVAQYAAGAASP